MNIASIGYQNNLNFGLNGRNIAPVVESGRPVVQKVNNSELVEKLEEIIARAKKDPEFAKNMTKAIEDALRGKEYGPSHIVFFPRTPEQEGVDAVVKKLK